MIYFALENTSWLTMSNAVLAFGLLLSAGNAFIILKSRNREEAHAQTVRLAASYKESWEKATKELADALIEVKRANDEADTFRTGYTALGGINIRELLDFATVTRERNAFEKECVSLHERLAVMKIEAGKNV